MAVVLRYWGAYGIVGTWVGWGRKWMNREIWSRNVLENIHLEDREWDGRITSKWLLRRYVETIGTGWNWLRIVSIAVLWFQRCWTFGLLPNSLVGLQHTTFERSFMLKITVFEMVRNFEVISVNYRGEVIYIRWNCTQK
jgi:hypothetical protein